MKNNKLKIDTDLFSGDLNKIDWDRKPAPNITLSGSGVDDETGTLDLSTFGQSISLENETDKKLKEMEEKISSKASGEEIKKEVKRAVAKIISSRDKKRKEPLSEEDLFLVEESLKNKLISGQKDWRIWRCTQCRNYLDTLDSIEKIKKYLLQFKQGKYKKCKSRRHGNSFIINNGKIIFQTEPISISVDLDKK